MASILIVDDSITSRSILKKILTEGGHEVVGEAADGEAGFVKYGELMPDVVTMDITMPKLNGIDSLKKIVAEYKDAKIIIVSAISQGPKILEALQSGAKNYISKPFEEDSVLKAINSVLGKIE